MCMSRLYPLFAARLKVETMFNRTGLQISFEQLYILDIVATSAQSTGMADAL